MFRDTSGTYVERVVDQVFRNASDHIEGREDVLHMIVNVGLVTLRSAREHDTRHRDVRDISSTCGSYTLPPWHWDRHALSAPKRGPHHTDAAHI